VTATVIMMISPPVASGWLH